MKPHTIAVLVGSLRAGSINRQLAKALEKLMPPGHVFDYVGIGDLPLYNQDHETDLPAPVVRFKRQVEAAQAVLFVTPEYNRSIPGVLKNAIDWGSRPYGKSSWQGRPSGVVGASPGQIGSALAQQHLRNILAAQGSPTLTTPEVFLQCPAGLIAEDGTVANEATRAFLEGWTKRYAEWIARLAA